MKIDSISIRHFRSIEDLHLKFDDMTALCGPNGCGKTNVFKAILFAFKQNINKSDLYENMSSWHRDKKGGPGLSIYIDMTFVGCSAKLLKLAGVPGGSNITYKFRATRRKVVERKFGKKTIGETELIQLLDSLTIVYVPPIRDILSGGIEPFRLLLKKSLQKGRRKLSPTNIQKAIVDPIKRRSAEVLADLSPNVKAILGARGVEIDTSSIAVKDLCDQVGIRVNVSGARVRIEDLGTGHQSTLVIDLFKRFGQQSNGDVAYLFEEPDNHLHPSAINAVVDELQDLSGTTQVILTSHSPLLLRRLEFSNIIPLTLNQEGETSQREVNLSRYSDRAMRVKLDNHGLRAIEPLLCKRIAVVEGATDAIALEALIELRYGQTCDQMNLLIIPAGGKHQVSRLCELLHALDVEWYAVLDWDATYGARRPTLCNSFSASQGRELLRAIELIKLWTDEASNRGRTAVAILDKMKAQIESATHRSASIDRAPLQYLMDLSGSVPFKDAVNILIYLKKRKITMWRALLKRYRIWLWSGTLEQILLRNDKCEKIVEDCLLTDRVLQRSPTTNRRRTLEKALHGLAHEPDILADIIGQLESNGALKRSELHAAVDFITIGL